MKTLRLIVGALLIGAVSTALAFDFGGLAKGVGERLATDKEKRDQLAKGATGLTVEEEINLGDAVSVEIVARYGGIWRNTVATQRVNLVGKVLARFAKRDSLEWRFGVLDSDAVNAFSAPNGRVFITKGLYKLLADDAELAGVLAHEIAHVDLRHAAKIIAGKQGTGAAVGLVADSAGDQMGGPVPEATKMFEDAVAKLATGLLTDGYGSSREYDADQTGYELAITSGFAPDGLRIALNKVVANTAKAKETFSTHPKTSDRLKKLPGGEKKKGK